MNNKDVDILIVGGGVIGAILMLALAETELNVLLVDSLPLSTRIEPQFDGRSLALSPASIRILKMLKVWPKLKTFAQPIKTIHVSEKGVFGQARLHAEHDEPLGYVLEMEHLSRVLVQMLEQKQLITNATVTHFEQKTMQARVKTLSHEFSVKARLVVAADGADSAMRKFCGLSAKIKNYDTLALVANIGLARDNLAVAYERFTQNGPLALLPMLDQRQALIWSLPKEQALDLAMTPEDVFLKKLQLNFGYRLGRFVKVGKRFTYPLREVVMDKTYTDGVVFIGNAAHTLHPVAGQGFNLGLRDVAQLAQNIIQDGINDAMLQKFASTRHQDQISMIKFTHYMVEIFTTPNLLMRTLRGAGLITLDNSSLLKNCLSRFARGFGGVIPDLVCGLPLSKELPNAHF